MSELKLWRCKDTACVAHLVTPLHAGLRCSCCCGCPPSLRTPLRLPLPCGRCPVAGARSIPAVTRRVENICIVQRTAPLRQGSEVGSDAQPHLRGKEGMSGALSTGIVQFRYGRPGCKSRRGSGGEGKGLPNVFDSSCDRRYGPGASDGAPATGQWQPQRRSQGRGTATTTGAAQSCMQRCHKVSDACGVFTLPQLQL